MELLNLNIDEQEGLESFIYRNTKTEISNFEGSFRPGLFSRIESSSSFESSFENETENINNYIKEERPLSKSYKPDSILKASFLTEERNSPSFRDFENSTSKIQLHGKQIEELSEFQQEFFKYSDINKEVLNEKPEENLYENKEIEKFPELKEFFYKNMSDLSSLSNDFIKKNDNGKEKINLLEIINKKDEEIKILNNIIINKDKEINEICIKSEEMEKLIEKISIEMKSLADNNIRLQEKLEKCENQLVSARNAHLELQKETSKIIKVSKEDRIRKIPDEYLKNEKIENKFKEILSENEYIKQELQKRPNTSQYQNALARIEELEGILSRRSYQKIEKQETFLIKSILEYMKLDNPSDILPLLKKINVSKGENKLLKRISSLIKDCAPPYTFKGEPTHRDI